MSMTLRAARSEAIVGPVVVRRQSSSHQRNCCSLAPGTKRDVNTCRNAGWSLRQLTRISLMMASRSLVASASPRRMTPRA